MDKKEISRFQIDHSKIWADGKKYFSLFEKHLPKLEVGQKVLIYDISNLETIAEMMSLGNGAEFWIFGNQEVNEALRALGFAFQEVDKNENVERYNIPDMKFDCIIMNPPYDRNLHLKILSEAIKHLKDEDSVCVNLSPVRWLQDPLAKFKKNSDYHRFEEKIRKHLVDVSAVNKIDSQNCFCDTVMGADLAIYECALSGDFNCDSLVNPIVSKVLAKLNGKITLDVDKLDGIRVRFPIVCNNGGSGTGRKIGLASFGKMLWFENGKKDGKWWHEWYMHNQYTKTTDTIPYSAKFESAEEATNFCKQFETTFGKIYTHWMKSDVNVTPDIILWVGNSVNPRTGKLGYQSEWTDEDFYEFFGITEDEKKTIEETMAKYK